jgi:hypothetical protein
MSELREIQKLEEQGFKFVGVRFKDDKTVIIDMQRKGKTKSLFFPATSLSKQEFAELFVQVGQKIAEIEKTVGKIK